MSNLILEMEHDDDPNDGSEWVKTAAPMTLHVEGAAARRGSSRNHGFVNLLFVTDSLVVEVRAVLRVRAGVDTFRVLPRQ